MEKLFEIALVEQCAPTLAGIKPANLFRYISTDREEVMYHVSKWSLELSGFGIEIKVIKECFLGQSFLIYIYRTSWIQKILMEQPCKDYLIQMGYENTDNIKVMLNTLTDRLCMREEFPHEIGLFLGYPMEDVTGFIENQGRNFTYSGHWKSYGDPEMARRRFEQYKKYTAIYKHMFQNGTSIIQLVAAA